MKTASMNVMLAAPGWCLFLCFADVLSRFDLRFGRSKVSGALAGQRTLQHSAELRCVMNDIAIHNCPGSGVPHAPVQLSLTMACT